MRLTCAILLCGLCAAPIGNAQVDGIQLSVITGAGGAVRQGAMAPIHVIVRNEGPAISAAALVTWMDSLGGPSLSTDFVTIDLPQNSAKHVTLYTQPQLLTTHIRVTLRHFEAGSDPRTGRVLAQFSEPVQLLEAEVPVLGVIGPAYAGLPNPLDTDGKDWGSVYYFPVEYLPDHALGWEMCDAVLYAPVKDAAPSNAALRALREWVFLGGDLVLHSSEPNAVYSGSAFRDFVPYVPAGQEQSYLEPIGAELIHSVGSVSGGEVILRSGEVPLVIRRPFGLGTVTQFSFDLSAPAFSRFEGNEDLWRRVLPEIYEVPDDSIFSTNPFDQFTESIVGVVTRTPDVRLQLFVVVLLVALYALAAGPGDYLLAKRYKRPMLTWVTFPSMVLVFTSIAFLGARVWVGGNEELHAYRSVTWFPEGTLYNEAVGYFASSTDTYALGSPDEEPIRLVSHTRDTADPTLVNSDTGERIQRIPTWTARSFTRTHLREGIQPIAHFVVERESGRYLVRVQNRGDRPIRPVRLTTDGTFFAFRENESTPISPNGSREIELPMNRASQNWGNITHGRPDGIWDVAQTRAPRYRSWDLRPIVRRRDSALAVEVIGPEPRDLFVNGDVMSADSVVEVHHIVERRARPEDRSETPEIVQP